jgi:replicative DNA helicase
MEEELEKEEGYYDEETGEYFGKVDGFEEEDPKDDLEEIWEMDFDTLEKYKDQLTEEEYLELLYMNYPSIWMEENLVNPQEPDKPLEMRFYQNEMINNRGKKKIARCGRQLGKCKVGSSRLFLADGSFTTFEELYEKVGNNGFFNTLSFNEDTFEFENKEAIISDNGVKDTFRISTKSGNITESTGNHPYYVWRDDWDKPNWVNAEELLIGDRVATVNKIPIVNNEDSITPDESELLGYLVGDGSLTQSSIRFTSETSEIPERMNHLLECLLYNNHVSKNKTKYEYGIPKNLASDKNDLLELIKRTGLFKKNSHTKRIPKQILNGSKEIISRFISGLWATDGYITHNDNGDNISIGIGLCNKELIRDIQYLLFKINIRTNFRYKPVKYKGGHKDSYCLEIFDGVNITKFRENIFIYLKYKQRILDNINEMISTKITNGKYGTLPKGIWNHIKNIQKEKGLNNSQLIGVNRESNQRLRTQYSPNRWKIRIINNNVKDENLTKYLSNDIHWDTVSKLEMVGKQQTYNVTVPDNHTLISDNFIEHNSASIQMMILYFGLKRKNSKILVIGPQKTHVEELFEACEEMLSHCPHLRNKVDSKRQPLQFTFHLDDGTKNRALFMTTGEESGGKGLSIRGKTANVLFIDEADYINDEVMEKVVIPTTNSFKKPRIWMSSTPTGRRGFFRNTWDSGFYSTFHYASSCSPAWSDEKEAELRASCTKMSYEHEYAAEWGDTESGLFSKLDMKACTAKSTLPFISDKFPDGFIRQYSFNDEFDQLNDLIKPKVRILGVDWNKSKNGTRLIWVDFDEQHNMWLRGKWKIDDAEFTQNAAMQKIISLHETLKFDHIMVDRGFGTTQIEDLHLYGLQNKHTGLHKIVKAVETDSQIEIADIATGETRKTYVKNFAVESLVRFMEQNRIRVPEEENLAASKTSKDQVTIFDEMNEYIIEKYTANGRPVYKGKSGDHDLDAFMFTLYGYITEVVKTQKLWDKIPPTTPKFISHEKRMRLRSNVGEPNLPGEKNIVAENENSVYNNDGFSNRSIKRTGGSRFGGSSPKSRFSRQIR